MQMARLFLIFSSNIYEANFRHSRSLSIAFNAVALIGNAIKAVCKNLILVNKATDNYEKSHIYNSLPQTSGRR